MRLVDIAKKLRVSHSTVSRALNPEKQHLISEPIRKKILELAHRSHFVPNRAARDLATGRTRTIGVILPTMFNSLFFNEQLTRSLAGLYGVLGRDKRYNCKLIILPDEVAFSQLDREILKTGIDGLLISAQYDHASKAAPYIPRPLLTQWQRPVVFINLVMKDPSLNIVSFSNEEAAHQATTFLIRKGHKSIGLIYGQDHLEDSQERFKGFSRALRDHRLPLEKDFLKRGDYTVNSAYSATLELFNRRGPKPTALFCTNDEMAFGALRALRILGVQCPQQVAVVGFDGLETGNYVEPRLTSVRQPSFEIAETGAQLLLDLIEGKEKGPVCKILPTEVMVRDSA